MGISSQLKLLWPFYLDALISPILFFIPAFSILYFSNVGLNLFQLGLLLSASSLASLLSEIPTGAFADLYGRKLSVLLGFFFEGLILILIFFMGNSFHSLLISFFFLGLAMTFSSGSKEAWVVDLINKNNKHLTKNYFTKIKSFDSFALIFSGILGAFFVKLFGLSIIWIVSGLSYFLSILVLIFAKEVFYRRKVKVRDSFTQITKQSTKSFNYSRKHKVLFLFFIAAAILSFAGYLDSQLAWTPFFMDMGLKEHYFGYLWSIIGLAGVIAPLLTSKLIKRNNERKFIMTIIMLTILVLIFIVFVNNLYWGFFVLIISALFTQMSNPAERIYFHRFIPAKLRASVGSVEAMWLSLIGIASVPLAGFLVDNIGARYTIFLSAIFMIPAAIIYYNIKERRLFV